MDPHSVLMGFRRKAVSLGITYLKDQVVDFDVAGKHLAGLRLESGERLCVFSVADKQVLLIFRSGGSMNPIATPGGMIPQHDAAGQLHFAFAVSKEDFTEWEKHLIQRGIAIESKVSWPKGGHSIYFRDPDNHLVELATPGIWEVY